MELTSILLSPVFAGLVLAHVIADFFLQSNKTCLDKARYHVTSKHLWIHAAVVVVLSMAAVGFSCKALWCALLIGGSHWAVDVVKSYMPDNLCIFIVDQVAHLLLILAAVWIVAPESMWNIGETEKIFCTLTIILIQGKPANILIKKILASYNVVPQRNSNADKDLQRAGALIGTLERILTMVFVMLSHYEAVGFIIAAKSLLRFRDADTAKTEYVLAGTLLSFGFALFAGLALRCLYV